MFPWEQELNTSILCISFLEMKQFSALLLKVIYLGRQNDTKTLLISRSKGGIYRFEYEYQRHWIFSYAQSSP